LADLYAENVADYMLKIQKTKPDVRISTWRFWSLIFTARQHSLLCRALY